jgi:hypothetical protein
MPAFGVPNVSSALERDLSDGLAKVEALLTSHIKGLLITSLQQVVNACVPC